jgi:hypothetical protein
MSESVLKGSYNCDNVVGAVNKTQSPATRLVAPSPATTPPNSQQILHRHTGLTPNRRWQVTARRVPLEASGHGMLTSTR